MPQFTIPGLTDKQGSEVAELLQKQLSTYNDLHLTLKHVHWNVVGPELHRRARDDRPAGRVGARLRRRGRPSGSRRWASHRRAHPGAILKDRTWDDYSVGRDTVLAHLAALDLVYTGVIEDTRKAIDRLEDLDLVSQDMFIDHSGELEKFQWFVRAHLENSGGQLSNKGASTEKGAARAAKKKSPAK